MWVGGYGNANVRIYDDGVAEVRWLVYEPQEGTVPAGEDVEIELTFNTEGLEDETDYFGELIISSNDPENPAVVIDMWLTTGVPELVHFVDFEETETSHELQINNFNFDDDPAPFGWEIGVFTPDDVLSGAAVWQGDCCIPILAYGAAEGIDQFEAGNRFAFLVWDNEADVEYTPMVTHDGGPEIWRDGETSEYSLDAYSSRTIALDMGEDWNMISINVDPVQFYDGDPGPEIPAMFEPIGPEEDMADLIRLLKDEDGRFWAPDWGFINIPYWNLTEGYQVILSEEVVYEIEGQPIPADADVPLEPSWNIVAYFPTYDLDASRPDFYVLSPIIDFVELAKNNEGQFMSPPWNFSNMVPWTEGQGYQVKIDSEEPIVLNYPEEQGELAALTSVKDEAVHHWGIPVGTGENMSVLVNTVTGLKFGEGDQIAAVNTAGEVIGVADATGDRCGLAVWGDDQSTESVEGAIKDEAFALKLWVADRQVEFDLEVSIVLAGKGLVYGADDFTVLDVNVQAAIPEDYYLSQNYPNPFNSLTRLTYGMPEEGHVSIRVFDVTGRLVTELVEGSLNAGNHVTVWDANAVSTGIYLVRMETSAGFEAVRKVMLIK